MVRDVLASIRRAGFRRILIVNGHGGNAPVGALAQELMADWPDTSIRFHNWWSAPRTWAMVQETGPASHASWMENFPWTRLPADARARGRKADGGFRPAPRVGPHRPAASSATATSGARGSGRTR